MQPETKPDEKSKRDSNNECNTESFEGIGKMKPKKIGLHQLAKKLDCLPRRAQSDLTDDEVGQFPKQKQADDQNDRIAERRTCLSLQARSSPSERAGCWRQSTAGE